MDTQMNVLTPSGDLTIFEVHTFRESLVAVMDDQKSWVLDLSQLGRIDAAGMQVLLAADRSGRFRLTGTSDALHRMFQRVGAVTNMGDTP
jgi:anti-anti-sigma factor